MGRWLIGAGVALGLALLVVGVARSEVEPGRSETVQVVSSQKLPNVPGKSVSAVVVSYAPGGKSGKHHHAGSVLAYVLTGEIRSENSATGPAKVYKAGESFFEPAGCEHLVSENASATEPAKFLVVFVAPKGATLTEYTSH